jgi:NADH dehydrogenase
MAVNLPETSLPRVVIIGAGFAGLTLARRISWKDYQVVIIDRNNFHQFQPLFYQVAMSGIEPSSISFPLRRIFRRRPNTHIRITEVMSVHPDEKYIMTTDGRVNYDILVMATGVTTNYYGNPDIERNTYSLKSVSDALFLRNAILADLEQAITVREYEARQQLIDFVIVGGGPTGVELAGSLAEMKKYILPREYPELNAEEMDVMLIQGADRLLNSMSVEASRKAQEYLEKLGVKVILNAFVTGYDGHTITLQDGRSWKVSKVIWAAGITGNRLNGLPESSFVRGNRVKVNIHNQLEEYPDIYVLGDAAYMEEGEYNGHPQVAQPAIQQARHLARNLKRLAKGQPLLPFKYKDLGSLATIGKNKAVADLPYIKTQGFFAWVLWLVVHLKSILGVKNKLFVLLNWTWSYFTNDQSLRIIVRHKSQNPTKTS